MAAYPGLWPETIRGLITHSADWTPAMRRQFLGERPRTEQWRLLLRHCGHGVPDLDRARHSASNMLSLIAEGCLQPFHRPDRKGEPVLHEIGYHRLPWPRMHLEALGAAKVHLRVTLSYFVEPNPVRIDGVNARAYPSHRLHFRVKHPTETDVEFRQRVNAAERTAKHRGPADVHAGWWLGAEVRESGSLDQDTWEGTAAGLALRDQIAVYPSAGWWKTRPKLECYSRTARYSLIVSILAPACDVDLYTEVATRNVVEAAVPVVT